MRMLIIPLLLSISTTFGADPLYKFILSKDELDQFNPCGQIGTIQDRIEDCNDTGSLIDPFDFWERKIVSTITTVSAEVDDQDGKKILKRWVLDNYTGKIWSPASDKRMTQQEAIDYCSEFNSRKHPPLGLSTWRLPVEEQVIGDKEKSEFLTAFNNPKSKQIGEKLELYQLLPGNYHLSALYRSKEQGISLWSSTVFSSGNSKWGRLFSSNQYVYGSYPNLPQATAACVSNFNIER
jgi:hypothetical protein